MKENIFVKSYTKVGYNTNVVWIQTFISKHLSSFSQTLPHPVVSHKGGALTILPHIDNYYVSNKTNEYNISLIDIYDVCV